MRRGGGWYLGYFRGVEFKKCLHVNINCRVLIRAADVRTNLSPERGCIMPGN